MFKVVKYEQSRKLNANIVVVSLTCAKAYFSGRPPPVIAGMSPSFKLMMIQVMLPDDDDDEGYASDVYDNDDADGDDLMMVGQFSSMAVVFQVGFSWARTVVD